MGTKNISQKWGARIGQAKIESETKRNAEHIHTYIHTYILTYTYIHIHTHTYIHTYIHTYMCV